MESAPPATAFGARYGRTIETTRRTASAGERRRSVRICGELKISPAIGEYAAFADFAFQLFTMGITLPTVENWNDETPKENPPGHHQFLFRLQTGGQADISSFTSKLREDAQLIGAVYADKLSPHNLRHIRIAARIGTWIVQRSST